MFQYSPVLGHSSIWDLKYTFSDSFHSVAILELKRGLGGWVATAAHASTPV